MSLKLPSFTLQILAVLLTVVCTSASAQYGGNHQSEHRDDVEVIDEVTCESVKGRVNYCSIDTRGEVVLSQQYSRSACIEGDTWGVDRRGVWVSGGCRAEFAAIRQIQRPRGRGQGYGQQIQSALVTCESYDRQPTYCQVPSRGRVRLINQLSRSSCREGQSWGFDRRGIWVSNGCRAEFEVY